MNFFGPDFFGIDIKKSTKFPNKETRFKYLWCLSEVESVGKSDSKALVFEWLCNRQDIFQSLGSNSHQ